MAEPSVLNRPLIAFWIAVAAILLLGVTQRLRSPSLEEAVAELADGDPDGDERQDLLRCVLAAGAGSSEPKALVQAAMAAIALDAEEDFRRLAERLGGEALTGVDPATTRLPGVDLGDVVLRNFLDAVAAERSGDRSAASAGYARVIAQGRLWRMPLVGRLATAGAHRVG